MKPLAELLRSDSMLVRLKAVKALRYLTEREFGYRKEIHVWITPSDYDNASLMILLAYILIGHPDWSDAEIEIHVAAPEERAAGEGRDRATLALPDEDVALIVETAQACRAAGIPSIVVLNVCGPVEVSEWIDEVDAVLLIWLGGMDWVPMACRMTDNTMAIRVKDVSITRSDGARDRIVSDRVGASAQTTNSSAMKNRITPSAVNSSISLLPRKP